ncbi:MAG: xanthine dehydrogenase family protein subunit M [Candidatus Aerophobetes bacterium]|nr:xanthine dehydrogenase family protein subunit M [Candidatus Aerophobetes bacterium]
MIKLQTNTRILAHEFEYLDPNTLDEALDLLDRYQDKNTKILAGGTDLLVKMKTANLKPDYLINIKNIQELNFITYKEDEGLKIGAVASLSRVERCEEIKTKYPALYEATKSMAAIAVKNMGTVAGNLCNGSPAADTAPPLIVYGAKVKLISNRGERVVPVEEFFIGVGKTLISSDELLTQVDIPELDKNTGSSFLKIGRVKADISKINLAVCLKRGDNVCEDCKIVVGSVAEKPIRVKGAENILIKQPFTSNLLGEATEKAAEEIRPITDVRSTVEYRYEITKVMAKEAIKLAWERSGGKI